MLLQVYLTGSWLTERSYNLFVYFYRENILCYLFYLILQMSAASHKQLL